MEQEKSKYRQAMHDSLPGRLKAGEQRAAEELVDAYHEQLYLVMRRLGHGREVSEDLVQESFLQAWRHIRQLRSETALNGWLYRIAANVSRQWWRRNKKKLKAASIEDCEEVELRGDGDESRRLEELEQLRRLQGRVAGLSRKLQEAIVLHYMQHLTISEAAEAAGIREGTFKSRLGRALQALREQMG